MSCKLKAFEEWKKNFHRPDDPMPSPNAEEAWLGALEWVLGSPTWKENDTSSRWFIDIRMVEKELGEKDG